MDDASLRGSPPNALMTRYLRGGRLLAVLLALFLILSLCACQKKTEESMLRILFFDVGQGDAALIRTADGDILIDAGGEDTEAFLCSRLHHLGVRALALVVFTSPEVGRIGGGDGVLEAFEVGEVWYNGSFEDSESAERLGAVIERKAIPMRRADAYTDLSLGGATLSVLFPFAKDVRESVAVLQLSYGEGRAVWMGNVTAEQELLVCNTYGNRILNSDVLVVGRNGSGTVTDKALLDAVSPRCAVISCRAGNPYGHPTGDLLERLAAHDVQPLRIDREGEIVLVGDGGAFRLSEAWED